MKAVAVVGKNYGDEGKGHAVAYFTKKYADKSPIVVKHNGGAQAGHTVRTPEHRIIFHQYGSGTINNVPTFLYNEFLFDPVSFYNEKKYLTKELGKVPDVYVDIRCRIVTIYDALMNQYIEERRDDKNHGSCGMGIWETVLRNRKGCTLTLGDILNKTPNEIASVLKNIRDKYAHDRLVSKYNDEAYKTWRDGIFTDDRLLNNVAGIMFDICKQIIPVDNVIDLTNRFETFIFEGAQGLLLDSRGQYNPYSTPSNTGLKNIFTFHSEILLSPLETELETCFVTRTYVTRHGNGPLQNVCDKNEINPDMVDLTNMPNPFQGTLRYAKHGDFNDFVKDIEYELNQYAPDQVSLYVTHLNETNNDFVSANNDISINQMINEFDHLYVSNSEFSTKELK